jgi:methionyl-tRNA formyltransferase
VTVGRARTVFIGSGGFGRPSLRRLAARDDVELVGVVTAPPRPAGRHGRPTPTVIQDAALESGVPVIQTPERLRAPEAIDALLALRPDLIVLADYGQIVPAALLDVGRGALNLHPSLLPRHRGATPIPAAILAGDTETGVTLMRMDEGLDTGPVVAQTVVPLRGWETAPELEARLAEAAADLLVERVGPWLRGEIDARPQAAEGMTMTRPLRREDGRLDVSRPAVELERQVRAYQPWPGAFVDTPSGRLIVWAAEAEAGPGGLPAGTFESDGIGTGDNGRLRLLEVQPAGGKRMAWDAYVRGRPAIIGASIVG